VEALRPDPSALQYDALAAAGAGAPAARLLRAADEALGVKAAAQASMLSGLGVDVGQGLQCACATVQPQDDRQPW
jgi:hypothetical protein